MGKCNNKLNKKVILANKYRDRLVKNATPTERRFKRLLEHCKTKPKFIFQKQWIEGEAFFISDFYFPDSNYTIELDGNQHSKSLQKAKDAKKAGYLLELGINTLRIHNSKVTWMSTDDLDKVLKMHKIK